MRQCIILRCNESLPIFINIETLPLKGEASKCKAVARDEVPAEDVKTVLAGERLDQED